MKNRQICENCKKELETEWIKIPGLKIEVTREVSHKNKSYNDIKHLITETNRLLRIDEVVWLSNSKYAKELQMDGLSAKDDFFFEQPFEINRKHYLVAGFGADSGRVVLDCVGGARGSNGGLGVRLARDLK